MIRRIGIVGTGDITNQFVSQINKDKYELVAVYTRRQEALDDFLRTHHLKTGYTDYDSFLADERIDCVYVGTPNQTHYEFALKALKAGKHVLCEKVLVLTKSELDHLYEVAKEKELVLLEGVTLFFMPLFDEVQKKLKQGVLGKISGTVVTFGSCKEYDPSNRFFSKEKGGGALFDIGTYALSAAVYLLGTDLSLVATDVVYAESGVDEKSTTILKNSQNEQAVVTISFRGKMPKQIILTGDKGYLQVDDFPRAEKARLVFNDGTVEHINCGDSADIFTYEMDCMNAYAKCEIGEVDLREVTSHVIGLMDDMRSQWERR